MKTFDFTAEYNEANYEKYLRSLQADGNLSGGIRESFDRTRKFIVIEREMIARYGKMFCVVCNSVRESYEWSHIIAKANKGGKNWSNMFITCKTCNQKMKNTNLTCPFISESKSNVIISLANVKATENETAYAKSTVLKNHWMESIREQEMHQNRTAEFSVPK